MLYIFLKGMKEIWRGRQYAPPGSDLRYNPMDKKYEYAPDSYELKHNYMEKRWEYAPPDSTLKYNPYEKEWEFDEEGEW